MFNTKILKIDSSKATHYYNAEKTAFNFQLEQPIAVASSHSIIFSLTNAYIPYSFYSLNGNNCHLDVEETIFGPVPTTTTRTITIPFGNYSATDFGRVLTQLLSNSQIGYTLVYQKINNTYSIVTTGNAKFLFQTGPNHATSCHMFLGLPQLDTIINTSVFYGGCITMNDIFYFQIKTDIGASDNFMTSDSAVGILEIIPISESPLRFISHNPINPVKFMLMSSSINNVKIALQDNLGRAVDLNGIPFLLTIRLDVIQNPEEDIPQGRDSDKTNLQFFVENPDMVNRAPNQTPVDLQMWRDYISIQKMLKKIKK